MTVGENNKQGVLNTGGNKVDVSGETSHHEDVDDVISHDIGTAVSLPHLHCKTSQSTLPHAVVDKFSPSGAADRSAARVVVISSHSATTKGSFTSPRAWVLARVLIASSTRSTLASQRGDLGRNGSPHIRKRQGTNWIPQAVRKAAGPSIKLQRYPMKYMIKIPHSDR